MLGPAKKEQNAYGHDRMQAAERLEVDKKHAERAPTTEQPVSAVLASPMNDASGIWRTHSWHDLVARAGRHEASYCVSGLAGSTSMDSAFTGWTKADFGLHSFHKVYASNSVWVTFLVDEATWNQNT